MSDNALCEDGYAYSADQKCCSQKKRGFIPADIHNFSPEAIHKLRTASRHILYLINEGYDLKQASTFVGNHFLLSERQRLAVMRSIVTNDQLINMKRGSAGRKEEKTGNFPLRAETLSSTG